MKIFQALSLMLILLISNMSYSNADSTTTVSPATTIQNPKPASKIRPIILEQGRIRVMGKQGRYVEDKKLIGAVIVGYDDLGGLRQFRIDSIIPYQDSVFNGWIYVFSSPDSIGHWVNSCEEDKRGRKRAFVMPGYYDAKGNHVNDSTNLSINCTSGAGGKCILFGYPPWGHAKGGQSLQPLFSACSHMVRADYCGDGVPHTKNGTLIEFWDIYKIQTEDFPQPAGFLFEAAWAPDGAAYLKKTRLQDVATLADIEKECPERYSKMKIPSDTIGKGLGILFNRSK